MIESHNQHVFENLFPFWKHKLISQWCQWVQWGLFSLSVHLFVACSKTSNMSAQLYVSCITLVKCHVGLCGLWNPLIIDEWNSLQTEVHPPPVLSSQWKELKQLFFLFDFWKCYLGSFVLLSCSFGLFCCQLLLQLINLSVLNQNC